MNYYKTFCLKLGAQPTVQITSHDSYSLNWSRGGHLDPKGQFFGH